MLDFRVTKDLREGSQDLAAFSYIQYIHVHRPLEESCRREQTNFLPTPRTWHRINLYHWKKFGVHGRNSKIESFKFQVIRKITSQKKFHPCAVNAICTRHLCDSHAAQRHSPMFHAICSGFYEEHEKISQQTYLTTKDTPLTCQLLHVLKFAESHLSEPFCCGLCHERHLQSGHCRVAAIRGNCEADVQIWPASKIEINR